MKSLYESIIQSQFEDHKIEESIIQSQFEDHKIEESILDSDEQVTKNAIASYFVKL